MIDTVCPICEGHIIQIREWYACASSMCSYVPPKQEEEPKVEEAPVEEAPVEEVEEEVEEEAEKEALDDEELEAYFEELPVKELKKLCKEADLSKKGKKADLVARLLE